MRHLTRRAFGAAFVVGLGTVPRGSAAQTIGNATFTVVDFFGQEPRSWEAVIGYPHAEYKHLAGSAASASTRRLPGDLGLKPVARATWQLIWTAPGPQAAAELAHCDSGFANYTQFAELRPRVWQAPDIQSQDVTAALNAAIAQRRLKFLVCRVTGNGTTGSTIFGSSLELVWG